MKIAVIGNSPTHAGVAMAADLALAGYAVRLARWTEAEMDFEAMRRAGGIEVRGEARHLVSGRLGKACPGLADDPGEAARGADLVILDFAPAELELRLASLAPHLAPGQVVHLNTCSYWSAFRAARVLREAAVDGIVFTESIAPTLTADYRGAQLNTKWLRDNLPLAAFPSNLREPAFERMRLAYPRLRPAANVLETSFANLNMLVHAAIALINVGWFDRAKEAGEDVNFWMDGSTASATQLAEAQDAERRRVSEAWNVAWASTAEHLRNTYGGTATRFQAAIQECAFYRSLPKRTPEMWRRWLGTDVPLAHVPFVEIGAIAGVPTPIHEAFIAAFGALLGSDFRRDGLTFARMGLAGAGKADLLRYAETGRL